MAASEQGVSSAAQKAVIRRASNRAQAGLRRLDQESAQQLRALYSDLITALGSQIDALSDANGNLQLEVLTTLRNEINNSMALLNTDQSQLFNNSLQEAAALGAASFDGVLAADAMASASDEAVRFVRGFVAADGLQLSDRLWHLNTGTRQIIENAIETGIVMGWSADRAAEEFILRGESVPGLLQAKANDKSARKVKANLRDAMTGGGEPLRQARRLFRTEMNRAHTKAYEAAAFRHPDAVGTKFLLSPNHPRPDICDMHANVNRYGLGRGVYPAGRNPLPAHPNTLSFSVVVFRDEVTQDDRLSKMTRLQWLELQPPGIRTAVLGSQKKALAFAAGQLREGEISSPWDKIKRRLSRAGVDAEQFERGPLAPAPQITNRPVSMAISTRQANDSLAHTLEAIDFVHSDGRLPVISLNPIADVEGAPLGHFRPARSGGRLIGNEIGLNPLHDQPEFTLTHEIGHFLDLDGIGTAGSYASVSADLMQPWRQAIEKSTAVRTLRTIGEQHENKYARRLVNRYLLSPQELWARSYSQYIAQASGDIKLNAQLRQQWAMNAQTGLPSQWAAADFEPIFDAIDGLFRDLGWRR